MAKISCRYRGESLRANKDSLTVGLLQRPDYTAFRTQVVTKHTTKS